ncbi:MAG: hypothetical protein HKL80_03340 [Acidimicrobiales bacterium]|nr:hypothetical protein [Acidimicrobiales bacterium]
MVDPTNDHVVATAHLAMLATLSMGVLGALHQFTPVITQRPLRSIKLSRATFLSWLLGSWLLPIGFATTHEFVVEAGGFFAGLAVILLVVNIIPALSAKGKGAPVTGLRLAVIGFVITACYGIVYVVDRRGNWFDLNGRVVLAHAIIGMFGWLGLSYVSVAEKLWPMFLLAHVPGRRRSSWVSVWAIAGGVVLISPALLFNLVWLIWIGVVVLIIGLGAHLYSLLMHVMHRRRKADLHLLFVVTSAFSLIAAIGLALGATLTMSHHHHLGVALTSSMVGAIGGWLLIAYVGHLHKVVPFILWSVLRGKGIKEKPDKTQLMFADLYNHQFAFLDYALVTTGICAVCVGLAGSFSILILIGGILLIATGLTVPVNLSVPTLRFLSQSKTTSTPTNGDPKIQ